MWSAIGGSRRSQTFYKPRHFERRFSEDGEPMTDDAPHAAAEGGLRNGQADVRSFRDAEKARRQDVSIERAREGERESQQKNERREEDSGTRGGQNHSQGGGQATQRERRTHG